MSIHHEGKTSSQLHSEWVNKYKIENLTGSQWAFSMFLFENMDKLDKTGDLRETFDSVYRYIKFPKLKVKEQDDELLID